MIRSHGSVPEARLAELDRLLGGLGSLERVLRALDGEKLSLGDVIPMDEYTIDILVDLPDGLTLAFDTT